MGTHPIFESDFDCLTENFVSMVLQRLIGHGPLNLTYRTLNALKKYGLREVGPPLPHELGLALYQGQSALLNGLRGGWYKQTTSQAALNVVVGFEIFCWFCIGECIGKG